MLLYFTYLAKLNALYRLLLRNVKTDQVQEDSCSLQFREI